jgi:hypothetical protein
MANPFGEIAANIGKEVAEGVAKKATMKAKELINLIPSEYKTGESVNQMWERVAKETDPKLIESIRKEGIREPINVVNDVINDGHHRIYAANKIDPEMEVPIMSAKNVYDWKAGNTQPTTNREQLFARFLVTGRAIDHTPESAKKMIDELGWAKAEANARANDIDYKDFIDMLKTREENKPKIVVEQPKVIDKNEDWKFIPKEGEITGTEYLNKIYDANRGFEGASESMLARLTRSARQLKMDWNKQLGDNKVLKERPTMAAAIFSELEDVGLPREYTGKVASGILSNDSAITYDTTGMSFIAKNSRKISNALRDMNDMQRETFLSLLPEWDFRTSNMDALIKIAREI